MGKTYKELKSKIAQLRFENSFLTSKVEKVLLENGRVKRELQVSNARIVDSAKEIEALKTDIIGKNSIIKFREKQLLMCESDKRYFKRQIQELQAKLVKQDGLPFVEEAKNALEEESFADMFNRIEKEKLCKEKKAFTSRFMPNVKFYITEKLSYLFSPSKTGFSLNGNILGAYTSSHGNILNVFTVENEFISKLKQVSAYEAIPELVPDGMVYDKESDSLVEIKKGKSFEDLLVLGYMDGSDQFKRSW